MSVASVRFACVCARRVTSSTFVRFIKCKTVLNVLLYAVCLYVSVRVVIYFVVFWLFLKITLNVAFALFSLINIPPILQFYRAFRVS